MYPQPKYTNTHPDDENPLDEGQAKAADSSVASCNGVGQTEGQAEPNPVEQEGHWEDKQKGVKKQGTD